jgi:hypothetical protein
MRLGGPQSRYGLCGEERNLDIVGNETPAVQPVAILTPLQDMIPQVIVFSLLKILFIAKLQFT